MTQKAEKIMKALRAYSRRIGDPGTRSKVLDSFNRMDQEEVSPVEGGDQEIKALKEMNELQEFENENWSRGSI